MLICDTHAHYDDGAFDTDRELLLGRELREAGIDFVVNVGASMRGADESSALAQKYEIVYAACGIHPDDVGVFEHAGRKKEWRRFASSGDAMEHLRELCLRPKSVCVGEIGLDYHWMIEEKSEQQKWFREQLNLAHELDLPINVHSRDAAQDTFDLICAHAKAGKSTGGIIHCYSGSLELAREYVKMGYHIGIGGVVTFKNAKTLKNVVREIPLEYLVTETDCPYLSPEPHRGKRNDSRNIRYVIGTIAQIKEMDEEDCARILRENAYEVYRLKLGI